MGYKSIVISSGNKKVDLLTWFSGILAGYSVTVHDIENGCFHQENACKQINLTKSFGNAFLSAQNNKMKAILV